MQKINYASEMEKTIKEIPVGEKLLLHSCCGPCSTAVLEQLGSHFSVVLHFYNPNIWPEKEYNRRLQEQMAVLQQTKTTYPVVFLPDAYQPELFYEAVEGYEEEPEGGARCSVCFALRLQHAAKMAAEYGIRWFTTTLTISPHKNAPLLNQIGKAAGEKYNVAFLPSDFKKKEGYKRSLELSSAYNLYRQEYCGCEFSFQQRQQESNK